ncbi:MAG TPA: dNTP triphosphohydrolase [Polyangiaceae bacterium]|nr:dNTP triphosphohydrolase [Polyangiaceae bacterium]
MEWSQLLSKKRVSHQGQVHESAEESGRSAFERDRDRTLFSTAFRRMHDKTQVFPLPEDDVVHSRLTHSLEVSSVGRSLGKIVGKAIAGQTPHLDAHDFGDVVAAACLAHDIGNPPFGHAGEDAIGAFFRSPAAATAAATLTPANLAEFQAFEGNAQGFRVLVRLQHESDGGMQLTAATLAAFSKYPRGSDPSLKVPGRVSTKKHGFFGADEEIFAVVAAETGLCPRNSESGGRGWCRHPLAFLVEAADDICYSILDIEDGVRLRLVEQKEAEARFSALAAKLSGFSMARLESIADARGRMGYLRAMAIGAMINESSATFLENERAILAGTFEVSLADAIPSRQELKSLQQLARERCYRSTEVIEIELAGYEALGGLLEHFVPAAITDLAQRGSRLEREQKALALLQGRGVGLESPLVYERLLRVADYVSGMTDRHALASYRRLKGIAIPGRAG